MRFKVLLMICFALLSIYSLLAAQANNLPDADKDGVPDKDEIQVYYTNPYNPDTDGDGYSDWVELNNGYSPHNPKAVKLEDNDADGDGLSDKMELAFHTNLLEADTDGDGYLDGQEINNGFDPNNGNGMRLRKRIEVDTGKQKLAYFLGDVKMGEYIISSGVNNSTPKGYFKITSKSPRAWSPYGLWMPFWLGLNSGRVGIHELPVWPNGVREGEDHLGRPASHGCIRLGSGDAQELYNWAEIGTEVFIY